MPKAISLPTPAVERQIVAFIRAGGYPHVAAEAAGVPRRTFERWLRRGRRRHCDPAYRSLAAAVMQASAQARLNAEVATRDGKPLDWLRYGPGKESAPNVGWTAPVRAAASKPGGSANALDEPETRARIFLVLESLVSHPELRVKIAEELFRPRRRQRNHS
jgi:hypothetical protein